MTDLEQRAFSPDEVATMLGVDRQVVSDLLEEEELGSKKIGGSHRIFLSDLEDYLGKERARSLVRNIDNSERSPASGDQKGHVSRYETIARKWADSSDDESIVLSDLEKDDIQGIRNFLYNRFSKEDVIVRSAKQEDGTFKAVIRAREGNEYLRE